MCPERRDKQIAIGVFGWEWQPMVYVDSAFILFHGMKMSHMIADTLEELHAMAAAIGLKRAWFQGGLRPHYDVSAGKRGEAIARGAKVVTSKELVLILQAQREAKEV